MPAKADGSSIALTVAVVDDDEDVREALSELLPVLDLSCRTFDRAESFMAECRMVRFDCLITDISMPGRNGIELLEWMRKLGLFIPVIIVTADTSLATRSRAIKAGAQAYLTKPVTDEVLIRQLESALKSVGWSRDGQGQDTLPDD